MYEEWKDIEGYNGSYAVSSLGRVLSFKYSKEGRFLTPVLGNWEYLKVTLCLDGKKKDRPVHRLVAEAFLENKENLPQVNHKDEVRTNNTLSNLEWCDSQYNNEYSLSKHYKMRSPAGEFINIFNMRKFCRDHGLNRRNIYSVLEGNASHHKGWTKTTN